MHYINKYYLRYLIHLVNKTNYNRQRNTHLNSKSMAITDVMHITYRLRIQTTISNLQSHSITCIRRESDEKPNIPLSHWNSLPFPLKYLVFGVPVQKYDNITIQPGDDLAASSQDIYNVCFSIDWSGA